MSDQDLFNTPSQEAERLASELGQVKEVLRNIQRSISNIESRAKRAFPLAFPKKARRNPARPDDAASKAPTMSAEQAMRFYDGLVEAARAGGIDAARGRLLAVCLEDLILLKHELGLTMGKTKPTARTLQKDILGRVNQSVMLDKHTDRRELLERNEAVLGKPQSKEV